MSYMGWVLYNFRSTLQCKGTFRGNASFRYVRAARVAQHFAFCGEARRALCMGDTLIVPLEGGQT